MMSTTEKPNLLHIAFSHREFGDELHILIFANLDPLTLLKIQRVCKRWQNIIAHETWKQHSPVPFKITATIDYLKINKEIPFIRIARLQEGPVPPLILRFQVFDKFIAFINFTTAMHSIYYFEKTAPLKTGAHGPLLFNEKWIVKNIDSRLTLHHLETSGEFEKDFSPFLHQENELYGNFLVQYQSGGQVLFIDLQANILGESTDQIKFINVEGTFPFAFLPEKNSVVIQRSIIDAFHLDFYPLDKEIKLSRSIPAPVYFSQLKVFKDYLVGKDNDNFYVLQLDNEHFLPSICFPKITDFFTHHHFLILCEAQRIHVYHLISHRVTLTFDVETSKGCQAYHNYLFVKNDEGKIHIFSLIFGKRVFPKCFPDPFQEFDIHKGKLYAIDSNNICEYNLEEHLKDSTEGQSTPS